MAFWKWVNRHNRLYALLSGVLSGLLTLAYLLASGRDTLFHWDSIALLAFCVVVLVFFELYAMQAESRAAIKARSCCDPEPLLECTRQNRARRKPRRRNERPTWFVLTLNEMAALSDIGALAEAEARLDEAEPWLSKVQPRHRTLYSMNRACLYLMQKKPEAALPFLQQCEADIRQLVEKKKKLLPWQSSLLTYWWEYRFQTEGPSEELLAQIREQVDIADTLQMQVAFQWKLAVCLMAMHRREEAFPYLRFVAHNGGKLWQRRQAEEQLSAGFPAGADGAAL